MLLVCAGLLRAQAVGFGVKGGVGLISDLDTPLATSESKRYVVGPMLTVGLPLHFRLELDGLYRRVGLRYSNTDILGGTFNARFWGNSWEIPILLQRSIVAGLYGGAGYVARGINGSGHTNGFTVTSLNPPLSVFSETSIDGLWVFTQGVVFAGGIEKRAGPLRFAPEVRYTRWNKPAVSVSASRGFQFQSSQNQVDLLLGITF